MHSNVNCIIHTPDLSVLGIESAKSSIFGIARIQYTQLRDAMGHCIANISYEKVCVCVCVCGERERERERES